MNSIGARGAQYLANALQVNEVRLLRRSHIDYLDVIQTLIWLNLWHNEVGDEGARHLGNALQVNKVKSLLCSSGAY